MSCAALSPDDLHFIGYFVNGRCRFHVDILDDWQLNRFFRRSSRDERRRSYERVSRQLDLTMKRLSSYLRRLQGGILIRTVLDLKQGALFYCLD